MYQCEFCGKYITIGETRWDGDKTFCREHLPRKILIPNSGGRWADNSILYCELCERPFYLLELNKTILGYVCDFCLEEAKNGEDYSEVLGGVTEN